MSSHVTGKMIHKYIEFRHQNRLHLSVWICSQEQMRYVALLLTFFLHRRMRFLHTPCKSGRYCERASSVIRNHQSGLSFKKFTWAPVSSTVKGKSIFTLTFYPDRSKMLINCENNWRICFLNIFLFWNTCRFIENF